MNKKKNFPIFISLFIVSLFFTMVFYYGYSNLKENYEYYMTTSFNHAEFKEDLSKNDIEKIKKVEGVKYAGELSLMPDSAKYKDKLIAINYQDKDVNKMREYSDMIEGRFSENENEIVLSQSLVEENNLKLGDKLDIELGNRMVDGEKIAATATFTNKEVFSSDHSQVYKLVGIYEDVYNKYSKVNYGLVEKNDINLGRTVVKFDSFEEAYENRATIQNKFSEVLGKNVNIIFDDGLINYYGLEDPLSQKIMRKGSMVVAVLGMIGLFIFFVKNIFQVWGLKKIRELSIYKSIGSTDFQIYKLLLKEAVLISILPILIGHIFGFAIFYKIYLDMQRAQAVNVKLLHPSLALSMIIILISLVIVLFAITAPAKKISKINIIDGIRGNIKFSNAKKKRSAKIWEELRINNLASIKSQRYISAVGIIIISVFIIVIDISTYYRDFAYFDDGYNITVDFYSKENKLPQVLDQISKDIPNKKSYISREKFVQVENNLDFSKEFKEKEIDKILKKKMKRYESETLEGFIVALNDKAFRDLGGKKGEFILYNKVQEDPYFPISKAKKITYFNNPSKIDIRLEDDSKTSLKISKNIYDLKDYDQGIMPFYVKIYTDFDTYFKFMQESTSETYHNYPFKLKMKVREDELENIKAYIETSIKDVVSPDEMFDITTSKEMKKAHTEDLETLKIIVMGFAFIILALNITNGYSSINLSLMSRKKEIGSLYSCGMDMDQLKTTYQKEFISEQVKSFILSIFVSLVVMSVISIFSPSLSLEIMLRYYNYWFFIIFSIAVYAINISIYHFSLKRILARPTIDLIRTI